MGRFTDWLLGRSYAEAPAGDVDAVTGGAAGSDGQSAYGDLLGVVGSPDPNSLLGGRTRYLVYNEMRLSDAQVRSILLGFKLPIRSAAWDVDPAVEGDDEARVVAEAIRWQFGLGDETGRLDLSWDAWLNQRLLMLDFGSMFEEIIWAKDVEEWEDSDGDVHVLRPIVRMAPRFPSTIQKVTLDAEGRIAYIEQDIPNTRPIPREKLADYIFEREGTDWRGTSLLRAMYAPWRLKKALMVSTAVAWDRYAAGVPKIRWPQGGGQTAEAKAKRLGRNYRTHERAYITLEGPPPPAGGWDFEIVSANIQDPVGLLRHYDEQMASAALQMFSKLGTTERGSRAVGQELSESFYLAIQALVHQVAEDTMRVAFRRFVDVNFGEDVPVPRLRAQKVGGRNVQQLITIVGTLVAAGANVLTPQIINDILASVELPPIPEEEQAAVGEGQDVFPE